MNENRFIDKFQQKTDSELEYILENKKNYNEQAVEASIHILKERNGITDKLESIETKINTGKEKKEIAREKIIEEDRKRNNITNDPNAPELYSKKVIMVFCGIFSTIFGAVLLMYNMKQTNNQKARNQVLIFGILYTIITLVIVNLIERAGNLVVIINIAGGGILTEYFWNRFIGKELRHRKRSWIKPAIISVLITIPLILAMFYEN